jgi:hypothetical protein
MPEQIEIISDRPCVRGKVAVIVEAGPDLSENLSRLIEIFQSRKKKRIGARITKTEK